MRRLKGATTGKRQVKGKELWERRKMWRRVRVKEERERERKKERKYYESEE